MLTQGPHYSPELLAKSCCQNDGTESDSWVWRPGAPTAPTPPTITFFFCKSVEMLQKYRNGQRLGGTHRVDVDEEGF